MAVFADPCAPGHFLEETRLALIDRARHALDRATSVTEVKTIRDQAEAIRVFLKQQQASLAAQNRAAELKLYAERRLGELLRRTVRKGGPPKLQREASLPEGISRAQSHRLQLVASVPEQRFEEHLADVRARGEELTSFGVRKLAQQIRRDSRIREISAPNTGEYATTSLDDLIASGKQFATIYADPPWQYRNHRSNGAAANHYPTLALDQIEALPVSQLAAEAAHLHLWTTNAFLFEAREVLEAWGFEYRSCFVWVKPEIGVGNYWRVSHEYLLLGVRGSAPFLRHDLRSWAELGRTRHSEKPHAVRQMIETASAAPRLELFARSPHPGWTSWGNEIDASRHLVSG